MGTSRWPLSGTRFCPWEAPTHLPGAPPIASVSRNGDWIQCHHLWPESAEPALWSQPLTCSSPLADHCKSHLPNMYWTIPVHAPSPRWLSVACIKSVSREMGTGLCSNQKVKETSGRKKRAPRNPWDWKLCNRHGYTSPCTLYWPNQARGMDSASLWMCQHTRKPACIWKLLP